MQQALITAPSKPVLVGRPQKAQRPLRSRLVLVRAEGEQQPSAETPKPPPRTAYIDEASRRGLCGCGAPAIP